ncbi:hypothetical protein [Kribbella sp. HUAS MG21]|uniref:Uncharacterized protein n=1 Tax=Kribbella sp. HUAS MG21 TaxID=3160966 RepID=A0AAU7TGA8_9ACTN
MMLYEIHIQNFPDTESALATQAPIAHTLCPDPDHNTPCEIPWSFTLGDDNNLILGIYTTPAKATALTETIATLTHHPTALHQATPGHFNELETQYRIEHP